MNCYIALNDAGRKPIEMPDMYRWVDVLLFSSLLDISFDKAQHEFAIHDWNLTQKTRMKVIRYQILDFLAKKKGNEIIYLWVSDIDLTQRFDAFK